VCSLAGLLFEGKNKDEIILIYGLYSLLILLLFNILVLGRIMKRFIIFIFVILLISVSCSRSSYGKPDSKMESESAAAPVLAEMNKDFSGITNADNNSVDTSIFRERKRIMNAHLEITVKDIKITEQEISTRVIELGGWIVSSNLYWGEISLVVKVPAESFKSFLSYSEKNGDIDSKSITTDDVTDSFYDLKNRIENKNILRDRFRAYLEKADSMEDILSVERQLNDVSTEIEHLEGSFQGLNRDIDYSSVTFVLRSPVVEGSSNNFPSFVKAFSALKYIVVSFFYYLIFIIIYLIIFGVPIILVLGLFYVLGWGKVGLIRKFFGKLKR
jgi:Domain of unknown function (DUF4349)